MPPTLPAEGHPVKPNDSAVARIHEQPSGPLRTASYRCTIALSLRVAGEVALCEHAVMLLVSRPIRSMIGVAAMAMGFACDDNVPSLPGEPIAETRDIIVYGDGTMPLCGGNADAWQAHIEAIARRYDGSGPRDKIRVVWTNRPVDYCSSDGAGCAFIWHEPIIVVGTAWSMEHELAHAASVPLFGSSTIQFLDEGFAEMWSDPTTLPREDLIPYISATQARQVRYTAAAHFLHWVEANYGSTVVGALLSGSEREDDQQERFRGFEDHLGGAFEEIQRAFWSSAPAYIPGFGRCSDTDSEPDYTLDLDDSVEFDVVLDCADDARGPFPFPLVSDGGRPYLTRRVDVNEAGMYRIGSDSGDIVLLPCDPVDDAIEAAFWTLEETVLRQQGPARTSRHLQLRPGRYQLWVIGPPGATSEPHVTILPSLSLSRRVGRD